MVDILKQFEHNIESFTLIPSDGGKFEITVNDHLIYSKLQTHRHTEQAEVKNLIHEFLAKVE
jgi:selenoprotein W-related protein